MKNIMLQVSFILTAVFMIPFCIAETSDNDDEFKINGPEGAVQYYDLSVEGISEYMDVLKKDKSDVHSALADQFTEMKERNRKVNLSAGTIMGVSALLGLYAVQPVTVKTTERFELSGEEYYRDVESTEMKNESLIMISAIGLISGLAIQSIWGVNSTELRQFINKHNRLNTVSPLKIAMNSPLEINKKGHGLTLSYSFL